MFGRLGIRGSFAASIFCALATVTLALTVVACGGSGSSNAPNPPNLAPVTQPPAAPQPVAPQATAPPPPAVAGGDSVELEFWQSVKDSGDADQLLAYIKKYPQGSFVELAESRLKGLSTAPPPAPAPPPVRQTSTRTAPPPPASVQRERPTARKQSRGDRVLDVVHQSLRGYRDPRLHIHPNIPRFKEDNAASVHGMDPRSILVLYDDGFSGGGKTGFAITDSRVYWRFIKGSDPLYLEFRDIQSAIARKNKFLLNGYDVGTSMSSSSEYAAQVYADLMLRLRDAFR